MHNYILIAQAGQKHLPIIYVFVTLLLFLKTYNMVKIMWGKFYDNSCY